jgi:mitochondrial fission protein ELM1
VKLLKLNNDTVAAIPYGQIKDINRQLLTSRKQKKDINRYKKMLSEKDNIIDTLSSIVNSCDSMVYLKELKILELEQSISRNHYSYLRMETSVNVAKKKYKRQKNLTIGLGSTSFLFLLLLLL